jgi:2-C-methyl-D-erythritol 2,4-cyclodiphosphate synthase
MKIRIGYGIDYHQIEEGIPFWIGGIHIPHYKGAKGHSDADVLLHAICDAMLGALALGDIGLHFPDTDEAYKGIDSKILLKKTYELVQNKGYVINNIDASLILEKPKIKPHILAMQETIAEILHITTEDISIKATTAEKMGFVGKEEGVVAHAVALLIQA